MCTLKMTVNQKLNAIQTTALMFIGLQKVAERELKIKKQSLWAIDLFNFQKFI